MNELLQQFLVESRELAEQATTGLLVLERSPLDAAQIDAVFRAVHTLKGGAGIVEFPAMVRALHAAEDLLGAARAGKRLLTPALVGDCLARLDQVLQWLDIIDQTGELPPDAGGSSSPVSTPDAPGLPGGPLPARVRELLAAQLALVRDGASARSYGHLASAALSAAGAMRFCGREVDADHLAGLATQDAGEMLLPLRDALTDLLADKISAAPAAMQSVPTAPLRTETTSRTLRVEAARIDALVRLTGELTVARNALAHLAKQAAAEGNPLAAPLKSRHATFDQLIGELQRSVLTLRVLPLRVVFQRFPRLLRDIADELGKSVALRILGDDTEADKAIVEMLFEPLLHVLRNAVDHGVEDRALRVERGKPPTATIDMRATRQGDQVVIEIADDGAGMDVPRIRAVAAERGMAARDVLDAMTEAEVIDLVFAPGFSTATEVTDLSGRGVGMDAVRTAVERVGGRVWIQSQAGRGTTVRFMLPFSVMMTTVMSVEAGGQMFGVPLDTLVETLRVPRSALAAVGAARAVVIRDQTVPVFDLAQMLGEAGKPRDAEQATLVIAAFAGQRCGLDVDALGERLDIILKPLDGLLTGTPGITGTSLLGDGRVLLVLDIAGLLQ